MRASAGRRDIIKGKIVVSAITATKVSYEEKLGRIARAVGRTNGSLARRVSQPD